MPNLANLARLNASKNFQQEHGYRLTSRYPKGVIMGNARMRTKPVIRQEEKLHIYVKNTIEAVIKQCGTAGITTHSIQVPFGATIRWEEKPTFTHPHWTRIVFYGYTRLERGFAHYEGEFGVWEIDLALWGGYPVDTEEAKRKPCVRTWGKAQCFTCSDEWRETIEQRRERLR